MQSTTLKQKIVVATWNVNSLRVRLAQVCEWLATHLPDVLALQEIKLPDAQFPHAAFAELGYHAVCLGQPTYNGVAFLVKGEFADVAREIPFLSDDAMQRRALSLTHQEIRFINVYVPNGESPSSPKFSYKLNWLQALKEYLIQESARYPRMIILGDFNIAPEDRDVHNPMTWAGQVLVSPEERSALRAIMELGFVDSHRILNPGNTDYSWWDYRKFAFKRNLGLRIDHVLVSKPLLAHCEQSKIDKDPRGWERPSDHAPVILTLSLP